MPTRQRSGAEHPEPQEQDRARNPELVAQMRLAGGLGRKIAAREIVEVQQRAGQGEIAKHNEQPKPDSADAADVDEQPPGEAKAHVAGVLDLHGRWHQARQGRIADHAPHSAEIAGSARSGKATCSIASASGMPCPTSLSIAEKTLGLEE